MPDIRVVSRNEDARPSVPKPGGGLSKEARILALACRLLEFKSKELLPPESWIPVTNGVCR